MPAHGEIVVRRVRRAGYRGGYGRVADFARRWRKEPRSQGAAGRAGKTAFVPLTFALGEAFQFDWSTEYVFVGGLRRRLEVAHTTVDTRGNLRGAAGV